MVLSMALLFVGGIAVAPAAIAEDGYDLWLRYRPIEEPWATRYRATLTQLVAAGDSATLQAATTELERGVRGLLGTVPARADGVSRDGALVVGTPRSLPLLAQLNLQLPQPGSQGYVIRSATLAGHSALIVAAPDDIGVLYGVFHLLRLMQTRQAARAGGSAGSAAHPAARARPLGQSRPHCRARLRRPVALGLAQAPRLYRSALHRLRASERIAGHQCDRADQRQRQRGRPQAAVSAQGGGARGRVASVRHSSVPDRALRRADRDRRLADCGSRRPGRQAMVAGEGRGDLPLHSRLRRLSGQGQLRRPARSAGLRPLPCRRREHARRSAGPFRRRGDVAHVRLLERVARRPRQAGVQRVRAARRAVPRQRAVAGEERSDRFPAARAVPSVVRRHAANAADAGGADHQGVSRLRHAPRVSRHDVRGGAARRHVCARPGLHRGESDRRLAAWLSPHWHRRRGEHRHRPQLERLALRSGQLVCIRPARVESRAVRARTSRASGCA